MKMFHVVHMLSMFDQSCTMLGHSVLLACFLCSSAIVSCKKPLLQSHLQLCCHCCEPSVQVAFSSLLNIQRSGEVESCVTLLSL